MKKVFLLFNCAMCIMHYALGQAPLVKQWDYRYGGDETDWVGSFIQTRDGGYILCGYSLSGNNGDKTEPSQGYTDFWVVKTDALGIKQWDKRYGGLDSDIGASILQTPDGGYIIGGSSSSGIGGDKTESNRDTLCMLFCTTDFWVVKTDSLGNLLWEKTYGGDANDALRSILQTTKGGYLLGGYSYSGISGDKTQALKGSFDYWIVRIDSLGNKIWDKDFGGNGNNYFTTMQPASGGAFIIGGSSSANVSGDKTQNCWGDNDYWILKIDSLGAKIWDKDYGGTDVDFLWSMKQTSDGGYILGGESSSPISGDKTQNILGQFDNWILKIDSLGTKQWDSDFGGTLTEDDFGSIIQTSDKGYIMSVNSYSPAGGNKSENNLGNCQSWIVKSDSLGIFQWDKTIFTDPEIKVTPYIIEPSNGCYLVAQGSYGGVAGYKTQPNRDVTNSTHDFWMIKFCDSTLLSAGFTAPQTICPGTCVDFTNLTTGASSFQWSFPGASTATSTDMNPSNICYQSPGSFDVQLIATNATGSDTLLLTNYITVYPFPPAQSIMQTGDTLFSLAGSSTYQWYFNGNLINGATNYFYLATQSGNYNVVATDSNGCEVEAVINNVIAAVSSGSRQSIQVYPNPVTESLYVNSYWLVGTAVEISICNVLGENMVTVLPKKNATEISIDVSAFSNGIYLLEISNGSEVYRSKFIKN